MGSSIGQSDGKQFIQSPGKQRNGPATDGPAADAAWPCCILGMGVKAGWAPFSVTGGGTYSTNPDNETFYRTLTKRIYVDVVTSWEGVPDASPVVAYERREWTRVDEVDQYIGEIKSITITDNKSGGRTLLSYTVADDGTESESRHANFPTSVATTATLLSNPDTVYSANDYDITQNFQFIAGTRAATTWDWETSEEEDWHEGGTVTLYRGIDYDLSNARTTANAKTDALAALGDVDLTEPSNLTTPETNSCYIAGGSYTPGFHDLIFHPCDEDDVADALDYLGESGRTFSDASNGNGGVAWVRSSYHRDTSFSRKLALTSGMLYTEPQPEAPLVGENFYNSGFKVQFATDLSGGSLSQNAVAAFRGLIRVPVRYRYFSRTVYLASSFKVCLNRLRHWYSDDVDQAYSGTPNTHNGFTWSNNVSQTAATKDGDDIGISLDPPDRSDVSLFPWMPIYLDWVERWLVCDQALIDTEHGGGTDNVGVGVSWGTVEQS